jgi:dTDP-4-amino-4,6-dideoxygalactose transaminase
MVKLSKWSIIMIPLFKVKMSKQSSIEVAKVLQSGYIGQGPKVEEFEQLLWEELGTKFKPVTVDSCTSAIDLSLELIGVGPGDEVICTPQTCFASNIGPIHRHAIIRWADIDPITGLIDTKSVAKLVNQKTKAIVCVNWAGKIADYKALKTFGVPVIEDAAHTWDVFPVNVERGNYICYSLQAIKYLTTGDGGILVCDTKEKEEEARLLRWFGLDRSKGQSFRCTQNITKAGFKYHMNDIAATIGICNIPEARVSVYKQIENTKKIITAVKNDKLILPEWDETCSYWLFSMHVKDGRKAEFMAYLESYGISSSPVHYRNDFYDCTAKFKEGNLPGTTCFDSTQICIPNGWWLIDDEIDFIIQTLKDFK